MAVWKPANLIVKGALNTFHQRMSEIPTVWQNHCQTTTSTTATEQYVWPGFVPQPREFIDGRSIQSMIDFTWNVENNEYELTLLINRKHFEDDQTGLINSRMREIAEIWATFKDFQFATLLEAGGTGLAYDGVAFYGDTRTIGSSANIDNNLTSAAATGTIPTSAEFQTALRDSKAAMWRFQDDKGRPFNAAAINQLRVIVPPEYEYPAREALNASIIGNTSNVYTGAAQLDVLPYLTDDDLMFVNAVGAERKPFLYQERTPLEVIMLTDETSVAENNGVLVLCRQRYVMTYGEPRRSILYTYS